MIDDGGLLPEKWDVTRDLLVVVGRGAEEVFARLVEAGQQRIFLYASPATAAHGIPRRVRVAHTPIELFDAILSCSGPLPKRVVVRRQTDPWATDEIHAEVRSTVEEAVRSKRLQARTVDEHGATWLLQGIAALPDVAGCPSIAVLDRAFVKRPCIIVSPGPSLERNVARLKGVRGRAVVMTCTHALRVLQKHGITPDVVVAGDSGADLLRHYDGVDTAGIEALVVGATCVRAHWSQPARRHLSFASNGELDEWIYAPLGEDATLKTGGSVACSELSLALRMGCDPIVFVGQDLAFTDGRYYSPSNVDAAARVKASEDGHSFYLVKPSGSADPGAPDADGDHQVTRRQQMVKVAGYNGGLVLTSGSFRAFLVWFETMARSLEGRVMLINATEGGASIRGMQHVPLADAMSAYLHERIPVADILAERAAAVDLGARRARIAELLERVLAELAPCLDLVTRCKVLAHQASRDPGRLERLQQTEVELIAALRPLRFLSLLAQGEIVAAQERVTSAQSLADNLLAAGRLFDVVENACVRLRAPLEAARAEIAEPGEPGGAR
jgi:hypothetical protein